MSHFNKDFLDFFKELAANNSKDWFDANRKRYADNVKVPFENFITDLITEVQKVDKNIQITHKEAIFRINRDIRFSKDKSPYKLNRSAVISPAGRKDKTNPGLYLETGPEHLRVYGGVYVTDKDQLMAIREHIAKDPKKLDKLIDDKTFKKLFGEVRGEKNKVLPKEFKELGDKAPMLYNKQFYWFAEFPAKTILDKNVIKTIMDAYKAQGKIMNYFADAMKG